MGERDDTQLSIEQARDLLMELSDDAGDAETPARANGQQEGEPHPSDARAGGEQADAYADMRPSAERPDSESADEGHNAEGADARSYAEGTVGLGVDIVEVQRMADILKRSPSFAERVFSQAEQDYCNAKANPATHYALRFAAKEAVVKALGTGFAHGVGVRDVEVERAASGRPIAKLSGRALEIANEQGVRELSLSLSYTHTDAVACAMAITDASIRASEKRKDPAEELTRQFKEVRGMLDEL